VSFTFKSPFTDTTVPVSDIKESPNVVASVHLERVPAVPEPVSVDVLSIFCHEAGWPPSSKNIAQSPTCQSFKPGPKLVVPSTLTI